MTVTIEEVQNYNAILHDDNSSEDDLLIQRKRLTSAICNTINSGVTPDNNHIAEITAAMHKDIQLRDFVVGITSECEMDNVNKYLTYFMDLVPTTFLAPIASVLALNLYSLEKKDLALETLSIAKLADPAYALALLLHRVFYSNWPATAFTIMTHELHPKVKEGMGI